MKRTILVFCLSFILLIGISQGYEYQFKINDTLSNSGKTITLISITLDKILINISDEDKYLPLGVNSPKNLGESILFVRGIYYNETKSESYAMVDFCTKSEEVCNNLDDDCDGKIDDGVSRKCGSNTTLGICSQGVQKCINGEWGYCENEVHPQNEICNNLDDNCNGKIDEDISRSCGNSPLTGKCKNGIQKCVNASWTKCEGYVFPTAEECNNLDDNCNGVIDEDLTKKCGVSDKGICKLGKIECKGGAWQACIGEVNPEFEWCDGVDNDCDGKIDNDCKNKGIYLKLKEWFSGLFN